MQITFDTASVGRDELLALRALIDVLAGETRPVPMQAPVFAPVADTVVPVAEFHMSVPVAEVIATASPDEDTPTHDSTGLPWDDRIHSTPPRTNADGTWRKRRGLDDAVYEAVVAELTGKATGTTNTGEADNAPATAPTPAAPPPPVASPTEPSGDVTAPLAPPAPPVAESASAPTAPDAAASAPGAGRFAGFPQFVQAVNAIRSPAIPYAELNGIATALGVPGGFKDLKDQPGLWDMFYDMAAG